MLTSIEIGFRKLSNTDDIGVMSILFFPFRVAWGITLLMATALLLYVISAKLILYFEYTSNVNFEVSYNKTMKFPAVTICNQNEYRCVHVNRCFVDVTLFVQSLIAKKVPE